MHINLYHASRLAYLSVSCSIYDFIATSKPQKNLINKQVDIISKNQELQMLYFKHHVYKTS